MTAPLHPDLRLPGFARSSSRCLHPPGASGVTPALVWFHGGGLTSSNRRDVFFPQWLTDAALARGWILLSPDYRLLLPFTSHDQLADVQSLIAYLASPTLASQLASASKSDVSPDLSSILLAAPSAGAYIARLFALHAAAAPQLTIKAFLCLCGMGGDYLFDHYVHPHPAGLAFGGYVPPAEVAHLVGAAAAPAPISESPVVFENGKWANKEGRMRLFPYMLQEATFLDHLTGEPGFAASLRGLATFAERERALPQAHRALFPQLRAAELPPTFFVHGDADSLVPLGESEVGFKALKDAGVRTELLVLKGAEHGFLAKDFTPVPECDVAYANGIEFLASHL